MNVSLLANALVGSEIIKIGNEVNELKRKGAKIANLTIGDFDPAVFPIQRITIIKPTIRLRMVYYRYVKRWQTCSTNGLI